MTETASSVIVRDHQRDAAASYLRRATLAGGLRVAVRPLAPGDRDELATGFLQLSPESRYRRFLAGKPRLTGTDLDRLVGTADQDQHIGLVLVWPRTSRSDVILGVAHAIRLREQPEVADVGIVVADEIQGQGAGRLLMQVLAGLAAEQGITHVTAILLPANTASARLLTGVGAVESDIISGGVRDLTVRLAPLAATPGGHWHAPPCGSGPDSAWSGHGHRR